MQIPMIVDETLQNINYFTNLITVNTSLQEVCSFFRLNS